MLIERNAPQKIASDKMDVSNIFFINANAGGAFMAKYNIGVDYHKKFSYFVALMLSHQVNIMFPIHTMVVKKIFLKLQI